MKTTQHGTYLLQLTRLAAFNCYLVREEDGFTLVDTGFAGSANDILQAAAAHEHPIRRILLTHAHADHAGSLDALSAQMPAAEIRVSPRTAQFLAGDLSLNPDEPAAKIRGGFVRCQAQPTRLLHPCDHCVSLRIIAAPGHSPDHIAFFDERDGTLIVGDAFQTQGGVAVSGTLRWLFPFPALATWHKPTALETARQLRALNPTRLAVGHGRVLEAPAAAMDAAIHAAGG